MKKTFTFVIAFVMSALVFSSCQKEGQYMPKKKISEISTTTSYKDILGVTHSTTYKQVWSWGEKLLNYIDYFDGNGNASTTVTFTYDDKSRLESFGSSFTKYDFIYQKNDLHQIRCYTNGELTDEYTLVKDDNKVETIQRVSHGSKATAALPINPFTFVLPGDAADMLVQPVATKGTIIYKLDWSDNHKNIEEIEIVEGDNKIELGYKYDEKTNPFKGFFNIGDQSFASIYSANNVVEQTTGYNNNTSIERVLYTYEYDGKFPTKKSWQTKGNVVIGDVTVDHTTTIKYLN